MKTYIIPVAFIAGVVGLWLASTSNSYEVVPERVIEEVEVAPEWATDTDAVEAAQAVIRKKELEAELEVLEAEVSERESRITEIEKELGSF